MCWKGGYRGCGAWEVGHSGDTLPCLVFGSGGWCRGCIGRLLAGASMDRSWGRCVVRGLSGLRSARGYKAGWRSHRTPDARDARLGGCRPLAWRRLVWADSGSAQGALLRGWEKSRGQASWRANLTQCGIPTPGACRSVPAAPGVVLPRRDAPGLSAGPPAWVRAAGRRIPERSTPLESRASAPARSSAPERPGRAETAQPYPRGRLRGLPQGHAERPDRPGGREEREVLLPASVADADSLLLRSSPSPASCFTEDAAAAAPSPGRIIGSR